MRQTIRKGIVIGIGGVSGGGIDNKIEIGRGREM